MLGLYTYLYLSLFFVSDTSPKRVHCEAPLIIIITITALLIGDTVNDWTWHLLNIPTGLRQTQTIWLFTCCGLWFFGITIPAPRPLGLTAFPQTKTHCCLLTWSTHIKRLCFSFTKETDIEGGEQGLLLLSVLENGGLTTATAWTRTNQNLPILSLSGLYFHGFLYH